MSTEKRFYQFALLVLLAAMMAYTLLLRSAFYNDEGFPRTDNIPLNVIGENAAGDFALFRLLESENPDAYSPEIQNQYVKRNIEAGGNYRSFAWPVKAFIAVPFLTLDYQSYFDTMFFWGLFLFGLSLYALFPLRASVFMWFALPAVFLNFAFGGFGLYVASALVLSLVWARDYPYRAGFFGGLLAAEPIAFLALLFVLAVRKCKKAFIGILIFGGFLTVMSLSRYGITAFFSSISAALKAIEQNPCGYVSLAADLMCTGVGSKIAGLAQEALIVAVLYVGYVLFYKRPIVSEAVQNAFICAAVVAISPVAVLGDFALTCAAVVFLIYDSERRGYLKADALIMFLAFTAVFIDGAFAEKIGASVQFFITMATLWVCWRRSE